MVSHRCFLSFWNKCFGEFKRHIPSEYCLKYDCYVYIVRSEGGTICIIIAGNDTGKYAYQIPDHYTAIFMIKYKEFGKVDLKIIVLIFWVAITLFVVFLITTFLIIFQSIIFDRILNQLLIALTWLYTLNFEFIVVIFPFLVYDLLNCLRDLLVFTIII